MSAPAQSEVMPLDRYERAILIALQADGRLLRRQPVGGG